MNRRGIILLLLVGTFAFAIARVSTPGAGIIRNLVKIQNEEQNIIGRVSRKQKMIASKSTEDDEDDEKKQSSKQIYSFMAGGLAGSISSTITCPMEVIKTQLQSSRVAGASNPFAIAAEIWKGEGVPGFFRGLTPTLVGIIPARACYFGAYSTCKKWLSENPHLGPDHWATHFLSGIAAGITGNTVTNPIWMVKTRMQLMAGQGTQAAYAGYGDAIKTIFKEEGISGFYKGLSASYWGCSEGCIQFVIYEKLKKWMATRSAQYRQERGLPPEEGIAPWHLMVASGVAKLVASASTYPHEVVRTRMREQAQNGVYRYTGMFQSLALIGKEEGYRGLYAGMGTHLARVVPNSILLFLSYELINAWLDRSFAEQPPPAKK
mmetsp:Transcript_6544/g.9880  ORF Transcript_6544/g.9880 Transcript_6544/m.9880 type:complete len:377 (-) Transcript_6544:272-1402(-)